ncbi:MAG: translation initiation factor IF-3, partial [Terriglobales bacterium]
MIDESGQQLGILPPQDALSLARQKGLDLVEVSANAQPPVCRIMDFGKYQYQMEKKAREARKHQRNIVIKEVKFRPNTDDHDYEFKKNNVLRFLGDGDKVKAVVQFRGREITHREIGQQLMDR